MTNKSFMQSILFAAMFMIFLTGCDSDDSSDNPSISGNEKIISVKKVVESDGDTLNDYVYFSLKNGSVIDETGAATTTWDLRFSASTKILTNSGETATELSSGGTGGVAYTGSTDFSAAVDVSSLTFETDSKPYISGHGGATATLISLFAFPGYQTGTGTAADPYATTGFTAVGYFTYAGMPPVYVMTDRVYVVRFGDGSGFARLQITATEYASQSDVPDTGDKTTTYTFVIKYEVLD